MLYSLVLSFGRGGIEPPTALANSFTVSLLTIRISSNLGRKTKLLPWRIELQYSVLHTDALTIWATGAIPDLFHLRWKWSGDGTQRSWVLIGNGEKETRTPPYAMQKRYTTRYIISPVARWISPTSLNRRLSSAYLYLFYGKKGEKEKKLVRSNIKCY